MTILIAAIAFILGVTVGGAAVAAVVVSRQNVTLPWRSLLTRSTRPA